MGTTTVDWAVSPGFVAYEEAVAAMERRADAIASGQAAELIWLLQHPPLYTAGTSTRWTDLIEPERFPVHRTGRGGQLTYHGPGQRVIYTMLDIRRRSGDVRSFVCQLESWIIATLAVLGVTGERRPGRIGVWVARPERGQGAEDKIAAIGIRVRRWISFHGVSLNIDPNLEHFTGIVPCGLRQHGVTSLAELGLAVRMHDVDAILAQVFEKQFATIRKVAPPVENTPVDAEPGIRAST